MKNIQTGYSVVVVLLAAGNAAGQGVNFSVSLDGEGVSETGVAWQAATEAPENDVFIGGGCTNYVRLLHSLLGLKPGDDIDALCYEYSEHTVHFKDNMDDIAGWYFDEGERLAAWHFSVDPEAQGRSESAVEHEVDIGTPTCRTLANPNEAHGDIFFTMADKALGSNELAADESQLGLTLSAKIPNVTDDLNALDLNANFINRLRPFPGDYLQPKDLYFSLAAGSPSLKGSEMTEDDILTPDGAGGFQMYISGEKLGIVAGSDLDALFFDAEGMPFFSVKYAMVAEDGPNANPGDILVPDGQYFPESDGIADELIPARALGLLDGDAKTRSGINRRPDVHDDNLDALDAETEEYVAPPLPEPGGGDQALPLPEEGEGEPPENMHPADTNFDWRIEMSEAIAYIVGWQAGSNPMSYAIRAAYLWQNGEFYTYDPLIVPPLCWILSPL